MKPTLREILDQCAALAGCNATDIRGSSRHSTVADARSEYCRKAFGEGYSWTELGRYIHRNATAAEQASKRQVKRFGQAILSFAEAPTPSPRVGSFKEGFVYEASEKLYRCIQCGAKAASLIRCTHPRRTE